MLYRNTLSSKKKKKKANTAVAKKVPRSVSKQAGRRRVRREGLPRVADEEDDTLDLGYIFCSDESPNKCWTGVELSEILQQESLERLGVKINLWAWRHIIIGITKAHLEEIAPYFCKDEKACKTLLESNIYYQIFPWQAGHQWRINVSVYGLDMAFPGRLQPALLRLYRQVSRMWHYWLGVLEAEEEPVRIEDDQGEEDDSPVSARKRRKVVDAQTQITPKKETVAFLDIGVDDSPVTKRLITRRGVISY